MPTANPLPFGRLLLCLVFGIFTLLGSDVVPPAECFPFERLSAEDRELAEKWLLDTLDTEGLFSIADNQKAVTLAFVPVRIPIENPALDETAELHRAARILRHWRCGGDMAASLIAGTVIFDEKRVVHAVVFRRDAVREVVAARPELYASAGIEPHMPAEQVIATVELLRPPLRHRAWGHLLGYPPYAVDFFATADQAQRESGDNSTTGIVPRDFYSVPTFKRETNHFVWAVPKGHQETDDDRGIRQRAAPTLERYRDLRDRMVGDGKPGLLPLVRELLCHQGKCRAGTQARSSPR